MGIGAKDYIDKLLVEKYSDEKVDNHENLKSTISADDVLKVMGVISSNSITQMQLSRKLSIACYAVNAMAANYNNTRRLAS
jgi:hypothetical protein